MTAPHSISSGTNTLREVIAGIVDPDAKFQDIEGVTWSRFEIQRRELAYQKANSILGILPIVRTPALPSGEGERPKCRLCGLEDGACICAHIPKDKADYKIGWWLSAALEDPAVCAEMKADINTWFEAHQPGLIMPALSPQPQLTTHPFARWADTIEAASLTISPKGSKELDALAAEVRAGGVAQAALDRYQVAKVVYATWLDADFITENHFAWYEAGKDNPSSCVHYSNVAKAFKVADRVLDLASTVPSTDREGK